MSKIFVVVGCKTSTHLCRKETFPCDSRRCDISWHLKKCLKSTGNCTRYSCSKRLLQGYSEKTETGRKSFGVKQNKGRVSINVFVSQISLRFIEAYNIKTVIKDIIVSSISKQWNSFIGILGGVFLGSGTARTKLFNMSCYHWHLRLWNSWWLQAVHRKPLLIKWDRSCAHFLSRNLFA